MFGIYINSAIDFNEITKDFIKSNDAAITVAAAKALTAVKAAQPEKTGELENEVGIKFFKQKNKLRGASIRVMGERYRVSAILENGTHDGRIKARHIFEQAAVSTASLVETVYTNTFFETLERLGGK